MIIRWSKEATRHLAAAAHEYVAADNPRAADQMLDRIIDAVEHLSFYPNAGREGRVKNTRELVIVNTPYIVAYRIKNKNTIQVLAVLHGKRRWPESF